MTFVTAPHAAAHFGSAAFSLLPPIIEVPLKRFLDEKLQLRHYDSSNSGVMMQRFTQFGFCALLMLLMLGVQRPVLAQDKVPQAKKVEEPSFTPAQKQVMKALSVQSPFTYLTDGKGKYKRIGYEYTEVNFAGSCRLHYVEHEFVVNEGVGKTDNVHRYTPTNVELTDLLAVEPRVVKSSEIFPPPDGFRYSADAFVIDFPGRTGKSPHRLSFEGEQSARHFIDLLRKAAQPCSAAQ